jgi:hypothetical protein
VELELRHAGQAADRRLDGAGELLQDLRPVSARPDVEPDDPPSSNIVADHAEGHDVALEAGKRTVRSASRTRSRVGSAIGATVATASGERNARVLDFAVGFE